MARQKHSTRSNWGVDGNYWDHDLDPLDPRNVPEIILFDRYCKMCDSHMNSKRMWAQHICGKRHLHNLKKMPGEQLSKVKAVPCNVAAKIQGQIDEIPDPVVGLDYICETRHADPDVSPLYSCRLCQGNFTIIDIIDHLMSSKHRWNYFKKESRDFAILNKLHLSDDQRESLVLEKVAQLEAELGRGAIEVKIRKVHGKIPPRYKPLVRKTRKLEADYPPYVKRPLSSHQSSRSSRPSSRLSSVRSSRLASRLSSVRSSRLASRLSSVRSSRLASRLSHVPSSRLASRLSHVPSSRLASRLASIPSRHSPSPQPSTSRVNGSSSTASAPTPPKPIDYVKYADKLTGDQWTAVAQRLENEFLEHPDLLNNDNQDVLYQCLRIGLSRDLMYLYNKYSENEREFENQLNYVLKAKFEEIKRFSK